MVEPHCAHRGVIVEKRQAFFEVVKVPLSLHLARVDGKIGGCHLLFHHALQTAGAPGRVEDEAVLCVFVKWTKERNSLDVIPVKVRDEDVCRDGFAVRIALELLAERAESCSTIKNIQLIGKANFDA